MELILLWLMSALSVFCLEENSLKHYQAVHLYSPNEVLNISFIHLYDNPVTIIAVTDYIETVVHNNLKTGSLSKGLSFQHISGRMCLLDAVRCCVLLCIHAHVCFY